jgi:hypothetical protein
MTLKEIDSLFRDLESKDDKIRYPAFKKLQEVTEKKVTWIYDKWFTLTEKLESDNSHQRTIGLTLLANLSKSDEELWIAKIIDKYLEHFDDEKFITARLCIQAVWKIALVNDRLRRKIINSLEQSYWRNIHLKTHGNLIRQDIVASLDQIFQNTKDKEVINLVLRIAAEETDDKIIKKLNALVKKSD